mgnify:CR=1 FL=1|tara:strand:- start:171 stop:488 length:318 start_codon:yes stop_codon:yes gene_type:complete
MNALQRKLVELKNKGWTLASISDELGIHWYTVQRWRDGKQYPNTPKLVLSALDTLLRRKRIPKRKLFRKKGRAPIKNVANVDLMKVFDRQQQVISRDVLEDFYYK